MKKEPNQSPEPTARAAVAHLERWAKKMNSIAPITEYAGLWLLAAVNFAALVVRSLAR